MNLIFTQSLTVNIPGNTDPIDGTIQFSISIDEGSEFVVGGSAGTPLLVSVEVTIVEDDGELNNIIDNSTVLACTVNCETKTY